MPYGGLAKKPTFFCFKKSAGSSYILTIYYFICFVNVDIATNTSE